MSEAAREPVRLERRGNVAIVTLDRPERMNALSRATVEQLGRIGRELVADSSVRAASNNATPKATPARSAPR